MKKILLIDRDSALVFLKNGDLEFQPFVFNSLSKIVSEMNVELVIANDENSKVQKFQNKILRAFQNEGIHFSKAVSKSGLQKSVLAFPGAYWITGNATSKKYAVSIEAKMILIDKKQGWKSVYDLLKQPHRTAWVKRTTKETDIEISLNLEGKGKANIKTGIEFFDHMLEQLAKHSGADLNIKVKGDLQIDEHHTIEDTAIALGEAFRKALGDKAGIERYGFCLPMDDCLAQVAIDFGGRNWLVWDVDFKREMIGKMPTEMFMHFFKSFSDSAKCNLNIKAEGTNEHHKIEAIFKAFARAIKMAIKKEAGNNELPSTKGILE